MSPYRRSEIQFFHDDEVKKAIHALAQAKDLVIYCGAGVTIDRTGLNWNGLIERIFFDPEGMETEDPTPDEIALLLENEDPQRVASALQKYRELHDAKAPISHFLTPRIQQHLYRQNGWQEGFLAKRVIELAVAYIECGKRVTIFTTNYDQYIEEAYDRYKDARNKELNLSLPTLNLQFFKEGQVAPFRPTDDESNRSEIRLIYLHGRVPRTGEAEGRLVVSEIDYVETRQLVVDTLQCFFEPQETAVLIVGSSLTDPPLVEALASTKNDARQAGNIFQDGAKLSPPRRYALLPISSTKHTKHDHDQAARLCGHAKARCELLSLQLLLCDFKFQIAQFCQELMLATSQPTIDAYSRDGHSYGKLLQEWWKSWNRPVRGKGSNLSPGRLYRLLNAKLEDFYATVDQAPHTKDKELFKLEVWARENPNETNRKLALWASSCGMLLDRSVLKREELALTSTHSSVRAFQEGRPQYYPSADPHSRWRTFLSVPIYVSQGLDQLPVGVVTLASTRERGDSAIKPGHLRPMSANVAQLRKLGLEILSADTNTQQTQEVSIHGSG